MISVVYCTRTHNPTHIQHIKKQFGHPKTEVIEYINEGESLTKFYNKALEETKNDIVVFMHDDVELKTNNITQKLLKHFNKTNLGIVGVAGTKELSKTGRWWDKPKSMFGRVEHTHQNKSWLSKYSNDINNKYEPTILVDGVFFAINKKRIKSRFNESYEGFHFYDVSFCFENYLNNVEIGVVTNIRINHHSIGETNDQWEENRKQFANEYKDKLPIKIKETFTNKPLKVLIGCLSFKNLTGSELSNLELAINLSKRGCDVTVVSPTIGDSFKRMASSNNVKVFDIKEPPFYKLGDGKWGVTINKNGKPENHVSKEGVLYKVGTEDFDIIHTNHTPITEQLLKLYPKNKFINFVRSEVIDLENPVIHDDIKKYVAIRPSIKEYLKESFFIDDDKIEVIYNGFDRSKFKQLKPPTNDKNVILFPGTLDYLRKNTIIDLIENNKDSIIRLVGNDSMGYAKDLVEKYDNVEYYPPTNDIISFYQNCNQTAGIMLGRTTIEGFLCGRPGWVYEVDKFGNILNKELKEVPEDLSIFDKDNVVNKIKELYVNIYNEK